MISRKVPFYSQKANWNGEDSGFPSAMEIERWQSNCCGIACVRMVLDFSTGTCPGYWSLVEEGLARGGYIEAGWIHRVLVDMVRARGVEGTSHRGQTLAALTEQILLGRVCIASVSPNFRGGLSVPGESLPLKKGGHLVVAFRVSENGIVCHHPSSLDDGNREDWDVDRGRWEASFSGNFMSFGPLPDLEHRR